MKSALRELMDAGVSEGTLISLHNSLHPLLPPSNSPNTTTLQSSTGILHITNLRAKRSGTNMLVDLTAHVPAHISVSQAVELEESIRAAMAAKRSEVKEVRVRFLPVETKS